MLETTFILLFVAFIAVQLTAGWALILFLWARRLSRGTRSFVAAVLGSGGLMVPLLILGSEGRVGSDEITAVLVVVPLLAGMIGLPTALLANRKLDRIATEAAAVFE